MRSKHDALAVTATCDRRSVEHNSTLQQAGLDRQGGVALILVMLAMLVLTMLAATIVFTARAETFASNNYKLDTQADYLAKAGIQRAVNWFRSKHYQAVTQTLLANPLSKVYQVTDTGTPYFLYLSNASGVQCNGSGVTLYACSSTSSSNRVQLIGYGSGSSNFPDIYNTEATPRKVITAFASDLNDPANTRITGDPLATDPANSGYFNINAKMLYYQTVILSPPLPSPLPSNCATIGARTYCAVETWMITSKGTWTGVTGSTKATATAEEEAIVQPIFWPTWGNALYGFCSVDMTGSSGTCTDAFNSSMGAYAMGNGSVASGVCDSTSASNVISTGAGVGANGGVTLGSNVTVGGNVTIGSGASAGCTASGYSGSTSSVLGEVINGPQVFPPPVPTFPAGFPSGAPNISLNNSSPALTVPTGGAWPTTMDSTTAWPAGNNPPDLAPPYTLLTTPCMSGQTCNGSSTNPYLLGNVAMTGSTLQLVGGPGPFSPVYYDIGCISQTGGSISVSGYVILNVQGGTSCSGSTGMDLEGNGISNGIACTSPCTNIPPEAVQINYAGSTKGIKIGGNGAISAVISAPLADVALGGGGANGYMVGSIEANTISVSGGYPIHYDVNLARVGGTMGTMISTAYGRKKM